MADNDVLRWLGRNANCELAFRGWDEDPAWEVHRVTGGRNDREWTLIGRGATPRAALLAAMERAPTP